MRRIVILPWLAASHFAYAGAGWKEGNWVPDPVEAKRFLATLEEKWYAMDGRDWGAKLYDSLIDKKKRTDLEDLQLLSAARLAQKGESYNQNAPAGKQYGIEERLLRVINSQSVRWESIGMMAYCRLAASPEPHKVSPDIGKLFSKDYPGYLWLYQSRVLHFFTMQYPKPWPGYPKGTAAIFKSGGQEILNEMSRRNLPPWQINFIRYDYEFRMQSLTGSEPEKGYALKFLKLVRDDPKTPAVVKKRIVDSVKFQP